MDTFILDEIAFEWDVAEISATDEIPCWVSNTCIINSSTFKYV